MKRDSLSVSLTHHYRGKRSEALWAQVHACKDANGLVWTIAEEISDLEEILLRRLSKARKARTGLDAASTERRHSK